MLAVEISFYLRADMIVRLLTQDNVDEIMAYLPTDLRSELVRFSREAYVPQGPRLVVKGSPLPEENLTAIRAWLSCNPT